MVPRECILQALTTPLEDTTDWHQHHFCDSNCQVCMGREEGRKADGGSQLELQVGISRNMGRQPAQWERLCHRSPWNEADQGLVQVRLCVGFSLHVHISVLASALCRSEILNETASLLRGHHEQGGKCHPESPKSSSCALFRDAQSWGDTCQGTTGQVWDW